MNLSPALKTRIAEAAKREAAPTRTSARRAVVLVSVAAVLFALALFEWVGGVRPGDPLRAVPDRPLTLICGTVIGGSLIAAAATWLAFARGPSMLGRRASWLLAVAILTPGALFVWMYIWGSHYPDNFIWIPQGKGFRCLSLTLAMAAWPLVALAYLSREKNPKAPAATGAARGVALGALAGILVDLWCPIAGPAHVLIGHITPILILMGIGAAAGRVLTGVRARPPGR